MSFIFYNPNPEVIVSDDTFTVTNTSLSSALTDEEAQALLDIFS